MVTLGLQWLQIYQIFSNHMENHCDTKYVSYNAVIKNINVDPSTELEAISELIIS